MVERLWVVMPAYNEQASLRSVLAEWIPVLRSVVGTGRVTFSALNDGSSDQTGDILRQMQSEYPELRVVEKRNSGHGQTCLYGYREALAHGAEWVFQMDSDGQCDPQYFQQFWDARFLDRVVYGYRCQREDGFSRFLISRVVSLTVLLASGVFVRDANVPYRLMHRSCLDGLLDFIPSDFGLANVLLAVMQQKCFGIRWLDIGFRQRLGGTPSVKMGSFARQGVLLYQQVRKASLAAACPIKSFDRGNALEGSRGVRASKCSPGEKSE